MFERISVVWRGFVVITSFSIFENRIWVWLALYCVFAGIGGSGRASATKLAAFMSDYELFQIEITKTYTFTDWREDVKKMLRKAGFDGASTVFLFGDHQLKVSRLYLWAEFDITVWKGIVLDSWAIYV